MASGKLALQLPIRITITRLRFTTARRASGSTSFGIAQEITEGFCPRITRMAANFRTTEARKFCQAFRLRFIGVIRGLSFPSFRPRSIAYLVAQIPALIELPLFIIGITHVARQNR
jgi:hypothetical protein